MEVIESGAGIVIVAAIADGVDRADCGGKGAFRRKVIAPRVVIVFYNGRFGGVDDLHHVALQVFDVIVICPVIGKADILARRVENEREGIAAPRLPDKLIPGVDEGGRRTVVGS